MGFNLKTSVVLAFFVMLNLTSMAQRVELTAFGGYQYWGSYKYYNSVTNSQGKLALGDGVCYGGILGFEVRDNTFVELVYNHQDSRVINKPYYGYDTNLGSVGVNYFQVNGTRTVTVSDKVEPYVTLGIGAALLDPVPKQYSSLWRFSANFGAGIKYFVSDKVGFRVGLGFFAPIQGIGFGVGMGTGGAYAGASAYTTIIQMNMTGGIIFRLQN